MKRTNADKLLNEQHSNANNSSMSGLTESGSTQWVQLESGAKFAGWQKKYKLTILSWVDPAMG